LEVFEKVDGKSMDRGWSRGRKRSATLCWTEREDEVITTLCCRLSLRMLIGSWNILHSSSKKGWNSCAWGGRADIKVHCRTNQGEDSYINSFWTFGRFRLYSPPIALLGAGFLQQRESAMHALPTPLVGTMKTYKFSSFPPNPRE
jgi:hypothetical protein